MEREQQRDFEQQQLLQRLEGCSGFGTHIDVMVKLEDLYTVYFLARANKRRSEDAVIFEIDYEKRLYDLCNAINDRSFRSVKNYTFITLKPKPREVFGCEMECRIIQWYINWRMIDILETVFTDRSFNNRKGMGTDAAIKRLQDDIFEVTEGYTRDAYVIQWDLSGYFPNANCDIACKMLQQVVIDKYEGEDKEDLLWMIDISIHANPQAHFYRKSPVCMWDYIEPSKSILNKPEGIGGAIGFLIWQITMNLYLNHVDKWAIEELGLRYVRFVDDTATVTTDKAYVLNLLPEFRRRYAEVNCMMHPKKFYCQHYSKGVHFLGSYIKFDRIYIANRTLRNDMAGIDELNRIHDKRKYLQKFLCTTNSYFGLLKHRYEYKNMMRLWDHISDEWKEYVYLDLKTMSIQANKDNSYHNNIKYNFGRVTA